MKAEPTAPKIRRGSRASGLNPRALGENPRAKAWRAKRRQQLTEEIRLEPFYSTEEWRQLRYRILRRSDGCCALCGRSKREHGVVLHVDHIKPRSRFPELEMTPSNLQVLCGDCNLGKGAGDTGDWRS